MIYRYQFYFLHQRYTQFPINTFVGNDITHHICQFVECQSHTNIVVVQMDSTHNTLQSKRDNYQRHVNLTINVQEQMMGSTIMHMVFHPINNNTPKGKIFCRLLKMICLITTSNVTSTHKLLGSNLQTQSKWPPSQIVA